MPLLFALGIVQVGVSMVWNKKTIDGGELQPKWGDYDARNASVVAGLAVTGLGMLIGMPILLVMGLGVASSSFVNKDTTQRVGAGLKTWIKEEADRALQARAAAAQQAPPELTGPGPGQIPSPPPEAPPHPSGFPSARDAAPILTALFH